MTATVGAYEAKTHLPALLARVEQGEEITITKHGREIARLVPPVKRRRTPEEMEAFLADLRAHATGTTTREEIREWIDEGRRERGY